MAYEGGYTSAVDSAQRREYEQAIVQQILTALARQKAGDEAGGAALGSMAQSPPVTPPPPGAPSTPMLPPMPPGANAADMMTKALGAPQGGPPMAPTPPVQGPPPTAPMPPAGGPKPLTLNVRDMPPQQVPMLLAELEKQYGKPGQPPQPPGWQASPGAPPALGGQPPVQGAPPGGPPQIQPPPIEARAAPMPAFSVQDAIKTLKKQGVPDAKIVPALEQMMPAIQASQRTELAQYKLEVEADKVASQARIRYLEEQRKERDDASKAARRAAATEQGKRKLDMADIRSSSISGKQIDEETLSLMADQYLAGDKSVAAGLGYGNVGAGNRAALRTEIMKKAKAAGMSGADIAAKILEYQGIAQSERTAGARSAQVQIAASEANKMADIVLQQSADFSRTQFQPINSILATVEKGGGGVAVRKYAASINSFINAYARAIAPTGVATVSDKDHAREILSLADSQEQLEGIIQVMQQEMGAALAAPKEVRGALRQEVTSPTSGAPTATSSATSKPKPTASDDAWVKKHPEDKAKYKAHFGVDPP